MVRESAPEVRLLHASVFSLLKFLHDGLDEASQTTEGQQYPLQQSVLLFSGREDGGCWDLLHEGIEQQMYDRRELSGVLIIFVVCQSSLVT